MSFEFEYCGDTYKYENNCIYKKYYDITYLELMLVPEDLENILKDMPADQLSVVMQTILGGYFCGIEDGKREKIKEFKKVFNLG